MKAVIKELLINAHARTAENAKALTAKTLNAGDPWSIETN